LLLAQHPLVDQADRLVAKPGRQRADFQRLPPRRSALRDHGHGRPDQFVEIIEDRGALDQRLAIVQHQRRHPAQRIVWRNLVGIAERRPRPMLERQLIQPQRERDTAHEGGVVLADQDHRGFPNGEEHALLLRGERCRSSESFERDSIDLGKHPDLLTSIPAHHPEARFMDFGPARTRS
jgi:hypothetical protein